MIAEWIVLLFQNLILVLLFLSIIFTGVACAAFKKPLTFSKAIEWALRYFILFNIGISYLYNFFVHVFLGDIAARYIGWEESPFQLEVGFASLGFGVIGLMAFWADRSFRAATVLAPVFFWWGAAGGHIYQIIVHHNFSPGNAGVPIWMDLLLPIIGLSLLWLDYRQCARISH